MILRKYEYPYLEVHSNIGVNRQIYQEKGHKSSLSKKTIIFPNFRHQG